MAFPKVLVETGFLLALNPRDVYHSWALNILENARRKQFILYISPVASIELSLIMKSRGYFDQDIMQVLDAVDAVIKRYITPRYPTLEIKHLSYAAKLRVKYPELTFFDSIHASIAICNDLVYIDLDKLLKDIISKELKGRI